MLRIGLSLAAIALWIPAGEAIAKEMTAAEFKAELVGKVLCLKGKNGVQVCARHNPDGTSVIVSGTEKQRGTWRLKGNLHCTKWKKIRKGAEFCSAYDKTNGVYTNVNLGRVTVK